MAKKRALSVIVEYSCQGKPTFGVGGTIQYTTYDNPYVTVQCNRCGKPHEVMLEVVK